MTDITIDDGVDMFTRGPGTKLLVIAARNHLRQRARPTTARKRQVVTAAPADFAAAVAEVTAPGHVRTVTMPPDVHDEKIGEEFSTRPFLY